MSSNETTTATLGSVLSVLIDHRGRTVKKLGTSFSTTGVPVISAKSMRDGRLVLDENVRFVEPKTYDAWMSTKLAVGDVLLTSEAPLGEVAYLGREATYCLGQRLFALRADPRKLEPRFLYYLLRSPTVQHRLHARATGTTAQGIRQSELVKVKLDLPALREQRAIASILGALDDKIDLNRRMNETLEAIARALFKSWFVDFDPVRAKAEGRQPYGMDADTAALFPDVFEDSSLGKIPKGWRIARVGDEVDITKGRSYASSELADSDTALVTLKSFRRGGGYRPDGLKPFVGQYKPEQVVRPGELVVAYTDVTQAADVIGKPAIVRSDARYDTLVASLDVGIIRPKSEDVSKSFLYCLFRTADFQAHTYGHATGTTVLHLSKEAVPSFAFVCAGTAIGQAFASIAEPQFTKIDQNEQEASVLAELRDTLLPKLLSGEVRVKGAIDVGATHASPAKHA